MPAFDEIISDNPTPTGQGAACSPLHPRRLTDEQLAYWVITKGFLSFFFADSADVNQLSTGQLESFEGLFICRRIERTRKWLLNG